MESPLNKKIQRGENRKAASPKKAAVYTSLREKVLALVQESNASTREERRVTPRAALTVMDRALASLSSLSIESREAGALREVAIFISTATKTFNSNNTQHRDLLVQGHPLSALNASLTRAEYREKYATWLAADSAVNDNVRSLVASAHAAEPGSIEREHAFSRLLATKKYVPGYFKIDVVEAITAAFGSGNSSAARRARVALQWRDRRGRWVEMGRGVNFNFRMPDGSVARVSGNYVGVRPPQRWDADGDPRPKGLIQVSGDKNLPDGIYAIKAGNAQTYSARLTPGQLSKAGITRTRGADQNIVNIPTKDELVAARVDSPTGWTKVDANTFTSDDNYTVKVTDGEYTLFRQNADGSLAGKVGEGANWADINDLATGDEESYDVVKGQGTQGEGQTVKARLDARTAHNAEFDRLEKLVNSGIDQNGNKVPAGWEGIVRPGRMPDVERRRIGADRVFGEEGLPYIEYEKAIANDYASPVIVEAKFDRDGGFSAYDKRYDSWEAAEADIPRWIKKEEAKRERKLEPIANIPSMSSERKPGKATEDESLGKEIYERRIATGDSLDKVAKDLGLTRAEVRRLEARHARTLEGKEEEIKIADIKLPGFEDGPSDYARFGPEPDDADYRAGYFDKDGNRLPGAPASDDPRPALTAEQEKKIDAEIRNLIENPPAPTEMDKRIEELLKKTREEWDEGTKNYARIQGEVGDSIVDPPMRFGPGKDDKREEEEVIMDPPKSGPKEFSGSVTQQIIMLQGSDDTDVRITGTLDNGIKYDIYKKDAAITWRGEREVLPGVVHLELSGRTFDSKQAIKDAGLKWDPDAKVWRKAYYNLGSFETTSPWSIQSVLEKLNGGNKLPGKEAELPTAEVMREQMKTNKWTPEILAIRNGVSVEEINAVLDNEPQQMTSERKPGKATENETRDEKGIKVPADSETVAMEQNGDAVVVRMLDGSLVQYDTEGPEGVPYTEEQKQKFINDIKADETIWFDEEGKRNWKALLDNEPQQMTSERKPGKATENETLSKEAFNGLKNKIAEENKEGYLKSGLYFFHDLVGANDGARSKDITFMIDDDEEMDPLGTISPDGTITWNDPSKEEDWAPALKSALKPFVGYDNKTSGFSYGDAKKTALDSSKSAQERYAAVFDGAAGENLFEYLSKQNIDASDVNSSVPRDAEVVFTDGDGQNLTVRYPDGSYHYFDTGATTQDGFIALENVNNFDSSVNDEFLGGLFKADGLPYYRGAFIDDKRQSDITSRAFSYDSAKKTALDPSKPAQERYAAVFDGAKGRDFFKYAADSGVERSELDPSIPEGTEVVFADGDGQNLTLRYPDGTYHYLDTGATGENGLITADPVSAYDAEGVNDKVLKDLLDIDSLMYARGGFIDDARQGEIARSSSGGSGSDEPPTPPSGPTTPSGEYGTDFTDMVIDGADSQFFMDRELASMIEDDDDPEEVGVKFADQMWDSADDRFDLQDQFDGDRPSDLEKQEFIDAAVAKFNKNLEAEYEGAIYALEEDLGSDAYNTGFLKQTFADAAEKRYRELLEGLFFYDDDGGELDWVGDGDGGDNPMSSERKPGTATEGEGLGFDETESILDSLYDQDLISLDDRNRMMQGFSDIMQDEERQIGFDDIESAVDDLYENDKITLEERDNIMAKATDLIQDQMPDEDGTYEMTSERKPGKATEGEGGGGGAGGDEPPTPPSGGGDDNQDANKYTLDFATDQEDYGDIGLDPEKEYTAEEIANAWITTNGLEGKVTFAGAVESNGMWPEMSFNIPDEHKDAFAVAYGYDSWDDLDQDAELDTRQEVSIRVPKDSVTVARDRNDAAVIVRMPDGSWVEYDNEENVSPVSAADRKKLLKDFKGEENIPWRDENGQMFFTEALKKEDGSGSDEPPTPPTGGGDNTPGGGFADYVVDLAEDNSDLGKDLEERLEDDAADVGAELMDQMYDDASRRYELADDIADNKPEGMSNDEFVRDAVAKMRKQLSDIADSAIDERRALGDDEADDIDFDKDAFIDSGAKRFEELLREELDNMGGDDEDGDDEPPAPPSGGTPPKTPTPSQPSTPGLFSNFDVPNGAFQLRTVDYEPEGRVDEASTNYTDDPKKLATRFTPQDLVAALSEALVGSSDDAAIAEILNANVDDAGDIPGAEDMDGVDIPRANMGQPSGAGRLEFNAGEEYVPMEALYNAVWEAGLDPNRVVANIYDSVNGNNNNLNRLIEAQGGVPSPEEAQLVDDITAEIRQIKSASPDSVSSVNKKDKSTPEEDPLPGQLIENVPIDFENPDYYIPDSNAYIPSQPEVDENGFTDNPEILSRDYETADLIDQMIAGITDGSGAALLSFDDITVEVPVEALRDAIQLQNINTNVILAQLKKESNDMSDDPGDLEDMIDNLEDPDSPAKPSGMPEQISNQKIKDKNGGEFELNLIKIDDEYEGALINKGNGLIQIVARDRDERVVRRALKDAGAHIKQAANGDEAMDDGVIPNLDSIDQRPQSPETSTLQAHSQMIKDFIEQTGNTVDDDTADKIRDAINEKGLLDWSEANEEEIIDAIVEVAGPGIFGLENPKPEFPESPEPRRFPPTTGERQAIERPVNPPAPSGPFDSEGFNNISNLIRTTFPRGFTDDNKLVAVWESNSGNESMMLISRGEGTEPILFRWQERAGLFSFTPQNTEDWFTGEGARVLGWRAPSDEQQATLRSFVSNDNLVPDSADTPRDPSVDAPEPEAPETPALVYPGPENRGYHPDNTVLDRAGKVMGKGTRIRASRDGRTGTVIAVQNIDNRTGDRIPYVRVRFDDGTIAVRSALKVRATGDAVQVVPDREPPATPPIPTDIGERLDAPVRNPGIVAGDGSITGVSNLGELPQELEGLGNPDARQTGFGAWGDRAAEIAFAGRNRVSLDNIRKLNVEWNLATLAATTLDGDERRLKRAEADEIKARLDKAIFDTFGVRDGVTFGNNGYTLDNRGISISLTGRDEESITRDHVPMTFTVAMGIKDKDGRVLGTVNRTLSYVSRGDGTPGYWKVKNDYLNINNAGDKKSGFATAYNRYMEDWYIANGVKEIHVRAAGGGSFQGAFVWALNGFNWETPGEAEGELMSRLQRMRRSANTDKERATIDRLLQKTNQARITGGGVDLDKAPTPMELALVGWYPGATNWLGKKFMTENSWSGIKRLDPAAKEQVQAINYDQIRRARSRIKDKVNRPNVSREFVLKANSDQFLAENQMLTPYIEEIRFAFQNNSSLATLSPAAKTVLSRWVGEQIMTGDSRSLPLEDAFKLRTALDGEAAADNPRNGITDFGVGDFLTSADFEDISRNRLAGFDVRRLGTQESGYNDTYLVKHIDSGQLFYVKKDELAKQYRIDPVRAEVEAGMLTRALGFQGMYETRANTKDTSGEVLVMQQAGSSIPLASAPYMLSDVFENGGIQGSDGAVFVTPDNLLDSLATPEDAIRIALLDLLINNQDRHNGNVLLAVDGTDPSRLRMLPVDHSLAQMESNLTNFNFEGVLTADDENVYTSTIPVLLERIGQDALIQAFRNEANKLNAALRSNTFSPSGNELRMIIDKYGSLNAYRDVIEKRTAALLTPGTRSFESFKEVLTPGYWR